jgi:ABC-type dipeptide/oligopeptide/nickel transport system permease subunit
MNVRENAWIATAVAIAVAGVVLFDIFAMWEGLNIPIQPQTVANVLAPLILAAAFIERAVEVVITPWRGPEASKRKAELDRAKASKDEERQKKANDSLVTYIGETTLYAFTLAFLFGLAAAMVGLRALWPFLGTDQQAMSAFTSLTAGQRHTFIIFDVVLSAALMTGGANGLHSPLTAFTSFFDASAQKSKDSAKASAASTSGQLS